MDTKTIGRPSKYNTDIAKIICERISTSTRGLEAICDDADLPCAATVWNWLNQHKDFLEMYARAREFQTELMYDDMDQIASAPLPEVDVYTIEGDYVGKKVDAGVAMAEMQRRKLRIDIIKFKLVKLQPKRFGENKNMNLDVNVRHQVNQDQYAEILSAALAAPKKIDAEDIEHEEISEQYLLTTGEPDEDDDTELM